MLASHEIETLPVSECLRLLETVPIGRMVFTERALPVVHPVNFLRHGNSVVIRTGAGTKLDAARRGDLVAFEADHVDPDSHAGWSVLIVGRAAVVNDVDQLLAVLDIEHRPWVRGRSAQVIRITAERITGRRLVLDSLQSAG
jgi:nitroimidazol reductase NimA-like FMN-containing flavoprotein (pyridoxamine 5'-phosphate oxidase superfamily)